MSGPVLAHKRDVSEQATQTWNLKALPDEFSRSPDPHRLFVAVNRQWRGYFMLQPWVQHNPHDPAAPWTLVFDANTWTALSPQPAPARDRALCYTLNVPDVPSSPKRGTR
jgi:hypothetical protein